MTAECPWEDERAKGLELLRQEQFEDAVGCFERALEKAEGAGDKRMTCVILGELAIAIEGKGRLREALSINERALAIAEQEGFSYSTAALLANIGRNLSGQGMVETATSYYERSLALFEETGNKHGQAKVLGSLGVAAKLLELRGKAVECFARGILLSREIGAEAQEEACALALQELYLVSGSDGKLMKQPPPKKQWAKQLNVAICW